MKAEATSLRSGTPSDETSTAVEAEAREATPGTDRHEYVVIGRATGRLRHVGGPGRPADELDEIIDEMFGEPTAERPGLFDLGLVVVGLAVIAWAWFANAGGLWLGIGAISLILGLVLPARDLAQMAARRRQQTAERHARAKGYLLDISAPESRALADAYERLLDVAAGSTHRLATRATESAYRALVEVATLLHGEPPMAPAERDYIEKRTAAIESATAELRRAARAWSRTAQETVLSRAERERRAAAVTGAREELEAADRSSSVDQLELVGDQLRRQADRGGE